MSAPPQAPEFRSVDQLSGRIAELEQECDDWCRRCSDALRQRDAADRNARYLSHELSEKVIQLNEVTVAAWRLRGENQRLNSDLATARAASTIGMAP